MKSPNDHFPKDWQLILFAAVVFFLAMQACTTTKQVHQERIIEETKAKVNEETKASTQAETNTKTRTTSETETTENCDSLLWVSVPTGISSKSGHDSTYIKVAVPIKFNRTIKRKEFTDQDQQKKEQGNSNILRKEQLHQKSDLLRKDKTVERTGLPWWAIAILVLAVLIGVAVLLWRLKVF